MNEYVKAVVPLDSLTLEQLRATEWSDRRWCGAGAPMHMQGPEYGCGTWDAACPSCGGLEDTPFARSGWIDSAIGHRRDCALSARIASLESAS